jgi:hypothetical protein
VQRVAERISVSCCEGGIAPWGQEAGVGVRESWWLVGGLKTLTKLTF